MVIEINKKHIITGITCIIVGIAIGVGGVFLFQNANEAPKEDKPLVTYGVKQEADLSTT